MRAVSVASDLFDFSIHFISFLIISLITLLFLLPDTFNFHDVVDKYPEDLGTLAENEPPTGYEPNDHTITEAYVEYTQESLSEQRFPDDFDDDDVTIGKTLLDACRRRADHSCDSIAGPTSSRTQRVSDECTWKQLRSKLMKTTFVFRGDWIQINFRQKRYQRTIERSSTSSFTR